MNVSFDSITINWRIDSIDGNSNEQNSISDDINGYYIYCKNQFSEWNEIHIESQTNSYTFNDLMCGKQYQVIIHFYNY